MKKHYISLIFIFLVLHLNAQIVNIPDSSFKARLLASSADNEISKDLSGNYFAIDANGDNEIQASEALNVATLDISSANIYSLAGLDSFTNLQTLDCSYNGISTLNAEALPALTSLNCGGNSLLTLDMSNLSNLKSLTLNYSLIIALLLI